MTKIFLDANILIDIIDNSRISSTHSGLLFKYFLDNISDYRLYTSCDIFTTVYYILRKQLTKIEVLKELRVMNSILIVIEFGNNEIDEAISLMEKNEIFSDLEDTIQYVMARKERCDYIISNDKGFISHDIPLVNSENALAIFE